MITQYTTDSAKALAAIAAVEPKSIWIHGSQTIVYTGAWIISPQSKRLKSNKENE